MNGVAHKEQSTPLLKYRETEGSKVYRNAVLEPRQNAGNRRASTAPVNQKKKTALTSTRADAQTKRIGFCAITLRQTHGNAPKTHFPCKGDRIHHLSNKKRLRGNLRRSDDVLNKREENQMNNLEKWKNRLPADTIVKTEDIMREVTRRETELGEVVYPPKDDVFNALKLTDPDDIKVIIIGQDPYHEPGQAMGLAFSVRNGTPAPPSLKNILTELSTNTGCPYPSSTDLTPWAKQGVLLLNTVLTVPAHRAFGHTSLGWQEVTESILTTALATDVPQVILCWGNPAFDTTVKALRHVSKDLLENTIILRSTHPSPLSANRSTASAKAFIGNKPFTKANLHLKANGVEPIDWRLA